VSEKWVMGIDTSSVSLNLAVVSEGGFIVSSYQELSKNHAGRLPVVLNKVLSKSGISAGSLGGVGVVAGPGSFTGLRVGLSVTLALRAALKIPVYQISTLYALAKFSTVSGKGAAVIDARKGEFYIQFFDKLGEKTSSLSEPSTIKYGELESCIEGLEWAVGANLEGLVGGPIQNLRCLESPNLAVEAAKEALTRLASGDPGSETVSPVYVREPDAIPQR
jgi:tRNA threonylcarbamoyladenosine biosynthesis protein TsaB